MNTTKETEMSDTPRTDAFMESLVENGAIPLEKAGEIEKHARQLERENAVLVEALRFALADAALLNVKAKSPGVSERFDRGLALLAKLGEA